MGWSFCLGLWGANQLRGKSLESKLCRLALWSVIYHVWQHRNPLIHKGKISCEEVTASLIQWEVRSRIKSNGIFWNSVHNRLFGCHGFKSSQPVLKSKKKFSVQDLTKWYCQKKHTIILPRFLSTNISYSYHTQSSTDKVNVDFQLQFPGHDSQNFSSAMHA